jgi:hypothetical protein
MRLIEALFVLALIVLAIWLASTALRGASGRRARHSPWQLAERSESERLVIYAERPGEQPLLVAAVPFGAEDFGMRVEEARAEGAEKLAALNSGRERSSR